MNTLFDKNAPKKSANLSINSDLLEKSKIQKINLSATLEQALTSELTAIARRQWLEQNKEAIDALNKHTDTHGLFSDSFREL